MHQLATVGRVSFVDLGERGDRDPNEVEALRNDLVGVAGMQNSGADLEAELGQEAHGGRAPAGPPDDVRAGSEPAEPVEGHRRSDHNRGATGGAGG